MPVGKLTRNASEQYAGSFNTGTHILVVDHLGSNAATVMQISMYVTDILKEFGYSLISTANSLLIYFFK